jgi:hypothetical protein
MVLKSVESDGYVEVSQTGHEGYVGDVIATLVMLG